MVVCINHQSTDIQVGLADLLKLVLQLVICIRVYSRQAHVDQVLVSGVLRQSTDIQVGLAELLRLVTILLMPSSVVAVAEASADRATLTPRIAAAAAVGIGRGRCRWDSLLSVLQHPIPVLRIE